MTPLAAKQRSEAALEQLGIPINRALPTIEAPSELSPQSPPAVVGRAFVLAHIVGVGYGRSGAEMLRWLTECGLRPHLTLGEAKFLSQPAFTERERAWAAWHAAAIHSCAWALQLVDMLPLHRCPSSLADLFPPRTDPAPAIPVACLRPFSELYAQADLHYRLHWAARQAQLEGHSFPTPEVEVSLRRKALDWIVGVPQPWDHMSLDT